MRTYTAHEREKMDSGSKPGMTDVGAAFDSAQGDTVKPPINGFVVAESSDSAAITRAI